MFLNYVNLYIVKGNQMRDKNNTIEKDLFYINGWIAILILLILCSIGLLLFAATNLFQAGLGIIILGIILFFTKGFKILNPNTALVSIFFGNYVGTLSESGFYWINPFYSNKIVSTKTNNHITPTLKVNDKNGNPIEIAATIVWHIDAPAAAIYDVENVGTFIKAQCESALRTLASHYPYSAPENYPSLSVHSENVLQELKRMLQERVRQAGVNIDEARFTHLAYSPEIAQSMLRKQQAQSVVLARQTIVEGAVSMVENAVKELEDRNIVKLDDQARAKLVTNMLTVLLSEESARPVLTVGSDS